METELGLHPRVYVSSVSISTNTPQNNVKYLGACFCTLRDSEAFRSSLITADRASGLMPCSHSLTHMDRDSMSKPVFSNLEISSSTVGGRRLQVYPVKFLMTRKKKTLDCCTFYTVCYLCDNKQARRYPKMSVYLQLHFTLFYKATKFCVCIYFYIYRPLFPGLRSGSHLLHLPWC